MICKWARQSSESRLAPLESSKPSVDLLLSFEGSGQKSSRSVDYCDT